MPMSLYTRNKVLDHSLGKTSWTMPAAVAVALFNGDPSGAGTEVEASATDGYARQTLTIDAAASGATQNSGVLTWGPNTGAGAWTVTYFAVYDSATVGAGNLLWYGTTTNRTVNQNDSYQVAAADLDFSLT